jgi:hypothetical protein
MRPKQPIRRFDVFAEYRKQEAAESRPDDEAKGYGLWVAKVVASRRFGKVKRREPDGPGQADRQADAAPMLVDGKWHTLDGEPQTDALFNREIVQRMGEDFYREVFEPTIRAARVQGKSYESIRDSIRRSWKPT